MPNLACEHYKEKNVYYNEKNHCNNIKVIAIIDVRCFNKIWGNRFVQTPNILMTTLMLNNLLFQISCRYRLLLYETYCNKLQIIDQNKWINYCNNIFIVINN